MIYSVEIDDFKGDYPSYRDAVDAASNYIETNGLTFTSFPVYRSTGSALSGCVLYRWVHKSGSIWF